MVEPTILFDDATHASFRAFIQPRGIITAHNPEDVSAALGALETVREMGLFAAGYFSYELGFALEPKLYNRLPPTRDVPLLWFGVFDAPQKIGNIEAAFDEWCHGRAHAGPLHYLWDQARYRERFTQVRQLIAAGDLYEANLTFQAEFSFAGDPMALYRRLRTSSAAPHGAYVNDGARVILSLSPELFFDIHQGTITTRPMKGTAPRMPDPAEDQMMHDVLFNSAKDRAENLMIVDLMRNDVSRIAQAGSVETSNLFAIESYPTVHQMVSTVSAQMKAGGAVGDIVRALFPCGSITGAPKIRAMEVLQDAEDGPRGVYTGAIGYFGPDGDARFNVAIRTLTIPGVQQAEAAVTGRLGIGGAVVYDSDAASEYAECLLKARYMTLQHQPLVLIETLRFTPTEGFTRLPMHLDRMAHSARYFRIPFAESAARQALKEAVANTQGALRVRLTITETGEYTVTTAPLTSTPAAWTYALSPKPVASRDLFARHKTSLRKLYEDEYARHNSLVGCDEVLFCNERGELAEGSRTNIFVRRDGKLLTPPLASGVLPGCLRRELIEMGQATEVILTPSDLTGDVLVGNSLRGLIPAVPIV